MRPAMHLAPPAPRKPDAQTEHNPPAQPDNRSAHLPPNLSRRRNETPPLARHALPLRWPPCRNLRGPLEFLAPGKREHSPSGKRTASQNYQPVPERPRFHRHHATLPVSECPPCAVEPHAKHCQALRQSQPKGHREPLPQSAPTPDRQIRATPCAPSDARPTATRGAGRAQTCLEMNRAYLCSSVQTTHPRLDTLPESCDSKLQDFEPARMLVGYCKQANQHDELHDAKSSGKPDAARSDPDHAHKAPTLHHIISQQPKPPRPSNHYLQSQHPAANDEQVLHLATWTQAEN